MRAESLNSGKERAAMGRTHMCDLILANAMNGTRYELGCVH